MRLFKKDGTWYYIDTNNYKRRQPDEEYEFLGSLQIRALSRQKKTGNGDISMRNFQPVTKFEYDGATPIF